MNRADLIRGAGLRLQPDCDRLTWPAFLDDVASRHGERCCIRFAGRSVSGGDIRREARQLAKALAASGVGKGVRVAVHMANRPEFAVVLFAVAMLGGVLVPINTFATPAERAYILRHSDSALLLFQHRLLHHDFLGELLHLVPALQRHDGAPLRDPRVPFLRQVVALGLEQARGAIQDWAGFLRRGDDFPDSVLDAMAAEVVPCDESLIVYTSGTTARPKGVLHLQRAGVIQSWRFAEELRYSIADRVWTSYPFFWSAGLCMALGACMASGATLVLQETFEPGAALQCLADERVNATQCWPHQAKAMAEHPLYAQLDLSRIDKEVNRMRPALDPTQDSWGTQGSYGMTETFTLVSNLPADAPAALRSGTSGKPLPGMQVRIVNPLSGEELKAGEPGEIAVKGLTLMRGYYKVESEAVFDSEGYFHSQDGGYLDAQGYLHWQGRLSNLIKTGGANVSPVEIEECLLGYPGMRAAVAFGAPHPHLGEVVILCAIAVTGAVLEPESILAYLRPTLAAYKLPRKILLFSERDLSFTGTQKIQTNELITRALARLRNEGSVIEGINYADYLVATHT